MSELRVHLPPEMEAYRADLEFFVSIMVRKLHTNRFKGTGTNLCPKQMLRSAEKEIVEARSAFSYGGQFEFGVECADASNFAFLAARGAWQMTRKEYEEMRDAST